MAHTHYHVNTQCDPTATPPFHNNSCLNRGAEVYCTLITTGVRKGQYACRHVGSGPSSKQTRRKTVTRKVVKKQVKRKIVTKKSTKKRVVTKAKKRKTAKK